MTSGSENMLYRGDGFVAAPPAIFSAAACCFARDVSFPTAWYAYHLLYLLHYCTWFTFPIAWWDCDRSLTPPCATFPYTAYTPP